jgi:hypothetical protein
MRSETAERYRCTLGVIEASLVLWRRIDAAGSRGGAGGRNLLRRSCFAAVC